MSDIVERLLEYARDWRDRASDASVPRDAAAHIQAQYRRIAETRAAALEEAAKLLDAEAARMDANWNEYRLSGAQGPATSLARIPATYAAAIRALITKEG